MFLLSKRYTIVFCFSRLENCLGTSLINSYAFIQVAIGDTMTDSQKFDLIRGALVFYFILE